MEKAIIAEKIGMTQLFNEQGEVIPVTLLRAADCKVLDKREESDGAYRVRIAVLKNGSAKVEDRKSIQMVREFVLNGFDKEPNDAINADLFSVEDQLIIKGVSKGKGFQGVVKRHGFGGGRKTHGSKFHKAPGSLGATSYPSRVFKGKKLPGNTGRDNVTLKKVQLVKVDAENKMLFVKGPVPGSRNTFVTVEA